MPVVFVIAQDWKLRAGVRAELRERGIEALGMESAEDAAQALAAGQAPAVVVLDDLAAAVSSSGLENLVRRIPTLLVASRTVAAPSFGGARVLYRPASIGEIVQQVLRLLRGIPA